MPYKVKKVGDQYCVYKKDGGDKVGCTDGNKEALRKYMAALHINANEQVNNMDNKKQKLHWQLKAGVLSESKYEKKMRLLEDAAEDVQDLIKNVTNYEDFVAQLGDLAKDPKVQAFLKTGKADGDQADDKFTATPKAIPVKNLRPTQNEIDVDGSLKYPLTKPDSLRNCLQKGPVTIKAPVVTYNGQFIIDGHHRWSQLYAVNKEGQINCVDLTGPKMNPIDVLKVVQMAIAADLGTVPKAEVKGNNLLKLGGDEIAKYVVQTITPECVKVVNAMRGATLGKVDAKGVAGKLIVPNVMEMQKTSQPAPGAPKRNVMPQTDDATNAMQYLAKGVVNFNNPYVAEQKLREAVRSTIRRMLNK